ncbi:MAG: transcription termination/antitermination protein NusA [Clostridia bacterium]|nr:transcription termination/antitermination protein NusA [Clostridia bacterium]MBQ6883927.1 transcription termination/antitermination protein NusA [Clostridia bacterium]MBR6688248.1 transcription termination/antitermination protein NusA [Clostridia bacterium]
MDKDFFLAIEDLEREKGISSEVLLQALEAALLSAYKKNTGNSADNIRIKLNPEKGVAKFYATKKIVEVVEDPEKEITLVEAKQHKRTYKMGDTFEVEFVPKKFGRIAAQTAKQVVLQKLRELERDNTIAEYEDKEEEIQNCIIRRIENRNVYVEIGGGQIEGVMLPQDQVPTETYNVNDKLIVYVKKVRNNGKNAQILVSRTAPGLVRRLFENEVPEIKQGYVEIKSIAREPGQRTKIAIYSQDKNIDAVGACVGMRGIRVNAVVQELHGEKIDIILWSEDPLEYISKALSPAKVLKVTALEGEKIAKVIVPDDKLSLAIGRDGQNARLAARLTGWKIDVKSLSKAEKEEAEIFENLSEQEIID